MTRTVATRTLTAGILCAAVLSAAPAADATSLERPDDGRVAVSEVSNSAARDTVAQLPAQGPQAPSIEQRRLIHHDIVQAIQDASSRA